MIPMSLKQNSKNSKNLNMKLITSTVYRWTSQKGYKLGLTEELKLNLTHIETLEDPETWRGWSQSQTHENQHNPATSSRYWVVLGKTELAQKTH